MSSQTHSLALPPGTILHQYQIESVLGMGGFGIVYKAKHLRLDSDVAIKEYLPQHCASRQGDTVHPLSQQHAEQFDLGIETFLKEAKQLIVFDDHPNIIRCRDFFNLNGTAYLVMNLEDGLELGEILQNHAEAGHSLTQDQILSLIVPVLEGLSYIHSKGVLHRDIKTANIFVRRSDGRPLLIDFGAAKQNFHDTQKSQFQMHTEGYAPLEQLGVEGDLGPWTDIYAVGAMMWRIITDEPPIKPQERILSVLQDRPDPAIEALEALRSKYSTFFIDAIAKAMSIKINERFQTAEEFKMALLNGEELRQVTNDGLTIGPTPAEGGIITPTPTPTPEPVIKRKLKPIILAFVAVVVCLLVIFVVRYSNDPTPFTDQPSSPTVKISIDEELDIIYTLVSKAEMKRSEILSNESVIDTLNSLGELDNNTKKNLQTLVMSNKKLAISIQENMQRARERVLNLVDIRTNSSDFDQIIDNKITSTAAYGKYEMSAFFKELKGLIEDASALTTKFEKQTLISRKLTI